MKEQNTPDTGGGPGAKNPYPVLLMTALAAAGLYLAFIISGHKPHNSIPALPAPGMPAARPSKAAQPLPAAPAMKPLGRPLDEITGRHTNEIKPMLIEPIVSGPLEGGVINKYHTGSGTDGVYVLNGAAYRRVMSFRLAEMLDQVEGNHAHFSGLVFIYGLYPSAFDEEFKAGQIPSGIQDMADAYGKACGALAEPGSPPQEHRELHDGYIFYCSNKDTTRLIYGVCSEGLIAAEAAAGK